MSDVNSIYILRSSNMIEQNVNGQNVKIYNAKRMSDIIADVWQFIDAFKDIGGLIIARIGSIDTALKLSLLFNIEPKLMTDDTKDKTSYQVHLPIIKGYALSPMSSYMKNRFLKRLVEAEEE